MGSNTYLSDYKFLEETAIKTADYFIETGDFIFYFPKDKIHFFYNDVYMRLFTNIFDDRLKAMCHPHPLD